MRLKPDPYNAPDILPVEIRVEGRSPKRKPSTPANFPSRHPCLLTTLFADIFSLGLGLAEADFILRVGIARHRLPPLSPAHSPRYFAYAYYSHQQRRGGVRAIF